jgi:hypothetical protein
MPSVASLARELKVLRAEVAARFNEPCMSVIVAGKPEERSMPQSGGAPDSRHKCGPDCLEIVIETCEDNGLALQGLGGSPQSAMALGSGFQQDSYTLSAPEAVTVEWNALAPARALPALPEPEAQPMPPRAPAPAYCDDTPVRAADLDVIMRRLPRAVADQPDCVCGHPARLHPLELGDPRPCIVVFTFVFGDKGGGPGPCACRSYTPKQPQEQSDA